MLTHLDTVPPGESAAWTETAGNPFGPLEKGDRLYGLGSADAKVDFVCKVAAVAELDRKRLRRPLRLVGTFGEEIGLLGTRWLVDSGYTRGFRHALIGEPSELVGIWAHKGYAVFRARVALACAADGPFEVEPLCLSGQSAHSSTPHLGRNAIELGLERLAAGDVHGFVGFAGGSAVNKVPEQATLDVARRQAGAGTTSAFDPAPLLRFHASWRRLLARLAKHRDADFDPDHTVGSLGRVAIDGNEALFDFDLRPIPGIDPETAVAPLRDVAEIECRRQNPPLATPIDAPLVRAVEAAQQAAGLERRTGTKATCTEAGLLSAAGLDALILGPGLSVGNVHKPNEHTRIPELALARDIYRETVTRLCMELRCSS